MKEFEKKKKSRDEIVLPSTPEREIPDPPVPNRAHTEMRVNGVEGLDVLTENEKAALYFKKDTML